MRALVAALVSLLLVSCEMTPTTVENRDVDDGMALEHYKTVCKGLEMKDEDVRTYAAENLQHVEKPIALECFCEQVYQAGELDLFIARGLVGSERSDMVECVLPAFDDPAVSDEDKVALADVLILSNAEAADTRLFELASSATNLDLREKAISSLGGTDGAKELALLHELLDHDEPRVRRSGAAALVGQQGEQTATLLMDKASNDPDGEVRAQALSVLKGVKAEGIDEMLCTAMLEDESPAVRKKAVLALKGSKDKDNLACLRKKVFTEEEAPEVRIAMLSALRANSKSWPILCDAIPFYMATYIEEQGPESVPGTDIAKAQNDVDWNNSYECFRKALGKRRGWSCKGHQYVAAWYREVGGNTHVPACEGDANFGVVSFE